jgi:hypothetical protein
MIVKLFIAVALFNIVNYPAYRYLFRRFFADAQDFKEALLFFIQPHIFSIFKGQFWEDLAAELRLILFFGLCVLLLAGEVFFFLKIAEGWSP